VRPGTYSQAAGETLPLQLEGASLIGTANDPSTTVIDGNGTSMIANTSNCTEGDVISGLTFRRSAAGPALAIGMNVPSGTDSPRVQHNVFELNDASGTGGSAGLEISAGGPGSYNPLIVENTFDANTSSFGAALRVAGPVHLTASHNTFKENYGTANGGAMLLATGGTPTEVLDNTFDRNSASNAGAAIAVLDAVGGVRHQIHRNTFTGNHTSVHAGAVWIGDHSSPSRPTSSRATPPNLAEVGRSASACPVAKPTPSAGTRSPATPQCSTGERCGSTGRPFA